MNRLILKFGYPLTGAILLVFAWVIYRRLSGGSTGILVLGVSAGTIWVAGTAVFIILWPRIVVYGFKRAVTRHGLGGGPIPVNSLYAVPEQASVAGAGSLLATGTDDVIYVGGWLEVRKGPQVLQVPSMQGRYYSVQFTDPSSGANFAYVGTRATGSGPGRYVLSAPDWGGRVPEGMESLAVPHGSALVIGRVFVANDADKATALELARQIRLEPLEPRGHPEPMAPHGPPAA